jgi:hypothetical protein
VKPLVRWAVFVGLTLTSFAFALALNATTQAPQKRSILFIGNSMIGRTVDHLRALSKAAGLQWQIRAATRGGARLENLVNDEEVAPLKVIDAGGWTDVIFVQGTVFWFEGKPGDAVNINLSTEERSRVAEKTITAALELHRHIAVAGARTVLYMGYPHMPANERTPAAYAPLEAIHWVMKDRLDAEVIGGKTHPTLLVPNGPLWILGANHFGQDVWYKDVRHGNDIALYANAVLFYAMLEGKDPRAITYDAGLNPADARWIREQAWTLARGYVRP